MITKVDKLSVYLRNTQPYDRVIGQRMETGAQSTVTRKGSRLHNKCNKSLLHVNF